MIKFILNNNNSHWTQLLKVGVLFILIGLLILLFEKVIIVLLASIFILIGVILSYFAFKRMGQ